MKLHFLGTTGYHPNNKRHTACLMLPEIGVVFDAGTGMFRVRDLIETDTLDIFLSHVHLDHCVGLTFLYDVFYEKPMKRVTVHVAEEKIDAIRTHLYSQEIFPVEPNFELRPLSTGPTKLKDGSVLNCFPLDHPGGSHGFKINWPDKSFAYVTDTTASSDSNYVEEIKDVGTLVHECYFPDGWEERAALTGHSCLTPVAKVAAKANAGRLFLVHINPLDESDTPFDLVSVKDHFADIQVASDRQIIDV